MNNFPFIEDFYAKGAAVKASRETLYEVLKELVSSPDKRQSIGAAASELMRQSTGAVQKAIDEVERYLKR
jgi:hypothetical protein